MKQEEQLSPTLNKRRSSKTGVMMSTPTKKPVRNVEIEMAAKKEDPFRDLKPKVGGKEMHNFHM